MENITLSNPLTTIILAFVTFVGVAYFIPLYNASNESKKGVKISIAVAIWASILFYASTSNFIDVLGQFSPILILVSWTIPSLIVLIKKDWFLKNPLSQKWLIGLQMFRIVGGVFILEIFTNRISAVFAYPAGLGDLFVGFSAIVGLYVYRGQKEVPIKFIKYIITIGVIDLIIALFLGLTTGENPAQLFFDDHPNRLLEFPTSMVPLLLVPIAIMYHTLSWLNYKRYNIK